MGTTCWRFCTRPPGLDRRRILPDRFGMDRADRIPTGPPVLTERGWPTAARLRDRANHARWHRPKWSRLLISDRRASRKACSRSRDKFPADCINRCRSHVVRAARGTATCLSRRRFRRPEPPSRAGRRSRLTRTFRRKSDRRRRPRRVLRGRTRSRRRPRCHCRRCPPRKIHQRRGNPVHPAPRPATDRPSAPRQPAASVAARRRSRPDRE
jgi:hypothetical protein